MSREEAKTVAVDTSVIPMGSKLMIIFKDDQHKRYSGIYHAKDTGGAIRGNRIDLFMGDFYSNTEVSATKNFGRVSAEVYIIK